MRYLHDHMTILHIEHVRTRCSYLCYMAGHVPMHPTRCSRSLPSSATSSRATLRSRSSEIAGGEISTRTGQGAQHRALRVLRVLGLCWGHPIGVTTPSAHLPLRLYRGAVGPSPACCARLVACYFKFVFILWVVLLSVDFVSRRRYLPYCVQGCAPSRP